MFREILGEDKACARQGFARLRGAGKQRLGQGARQEGPKVFVGGDGGPTKELIDGGSAQLVELTGGLA
ncbi:hypothetical protein D3C86_2073920 [compost metagenome]